MFTRLLLDRNDKKIIADTWQDVEPILENNHALRSMEQKSDWGRHKASVPNVILTKWLNEWWAAGNTQLRMFSPEFYALVEKKLNDPDWKFLKVDK